MWVRLVLRLAWSLVVETFDGIGNIVQHGEMDLTFGAVTVEIQTEVTFSFPILGDIMCYFRMDIRWSVCCLPVYLPPKLSTHRENETGRQSCVQKPGVSLLW